MEEAGNMRLAIGVKNFLVFGFALFYIFLLAWPVEYCLTRKCSGPDLDAFMPAFMFSIIGIPAVLACIFIILKKIWPESVVVRRTERGVWILLAVVAIGGPVYLGYRSHGSHLIRTVPPPPGR